MYPRLLGPFTRLGHRYAHISTQHPHSVAAATAGGIITVADLTCQSTVQWDAAHGIDWQRTTGLALFATWHYGVPAKYLYLMYDRVLGTGPTLRTALSKMLVDVYVHSPFLLVPSFYLITGTCKGQSLAESTDQLRREWFTASFGTALFWTPLCTINFRYVPQHSRILTVAAGSFLHKLWMSWLSNRDRHQQRLAAEDE